MMDERFKELLKDEDFLASLVEANDAESFGELLKKKEIVLEGLTVEEAFKLFKEQENAGEELDEEALENVSGGIALTVAIGAVAAFVISGGELCFLGGYAYQNYKKWKKKKRRKK